MGSTLMIWSGFLQVSEALLAWDTRLQYIFFNGLQSVPEFFSETPRARMARIG